MCLGKVEKCRGEVCSCVMCVGDFLDVVLFFIGLIFFDFALLSECLRGDSCEERVFSGDGRLIFRCV